jgi:vacuolar-type H+-ATPase subunit F/Vma7
MNPSVRVLCRPEIAPGFELAGVRADTATDGVGARARLAAWADDPAVGIVLIEQRLHRALPPDFAQRLERQPRPLVAPFPSPNFAATEDAAAALIEILRRAIGYRVRLP